MNKASSETEHLIDTSGFVTAGSKTIAIKSTVKGQQSEQLQTSDLYFIPFEESSNDSDLETQMKKFYSLLKATDSEKSDSGTEIDNFYEVLNSEPTSENTFSNEKDSKVSLAIHSSEESSCDLDTEIKKFYEMLNSENTFNNQNNSEVTPKIHSTEKSTCDLVTEMEKFHEILNSENTVSKEKSLVCDKGDGPETLINTVSKEKILISDKGDESDGTETLILCCESDLDDSIYDATVSELESVKNEAFSDSEKDITSDTSNAVAESDIDSALTHCDERNSNDDKQVMEGDDGKNLNENPSNDEYLEVTESDADSTLILCAESDLEDIIEQKYPICKQESIDIFDEHIPVDDKSLVSISGSSDLIPQQSQADNSCIVKVEHVISEPSKQELSKCCTVSKSKECETVLLKDIKVEIKKEKLEINEVSEQPITGNSNINETVTVKTEQSKVDPTRDFYEKEKDDIIDPRWQHVRELSTNEERYKQVKSCWGSTTVPDPDKNLSFHSYRRKKFKESQPRPIRQHKRQASTKLSGSEAKRSRPCTYMFDYKINSINREREEQDQKIMQEMNAKLSNIEQQHYLKTVSLKNTFTHSDRGFYNFDSSFSYSLLTNLQQAHKRKVACIKDEYHRRATINSKRYHNGIESLNKVRNEVLQFYSFYKGLSASTGRDPTILSDSQLQELDDIENFYSQMKNYYK